MNDNSGPLVRVNSKAMESFSVFYLVGGYANFVCNSVKGKFSWEEAKKKVASLENMGYKSMAVQNGHIVGGYLSHTDFESTEKAQEYYRSL